jgi:hypothetical protein
VHRDDCFAAALWRRGIPENRLRQLGTVDALLAGGAGEHRFDRGGSFAPIEPVYRFIGVIDGNARCRIA